MQLVFEFIADTLTPVLKAIDIAMTANEGYSVTVSRNLESGYVELGDSLATAAMKLERGEIGSFTARPIQGNVRYVMVSSPYFGGQALSMYSGTIETVSSDYGALWNELLRMGGIRLICVGFEEGVELSDKTLTVEAFPWNEWPLVVGAIKENPDQPWIVREGPEIKWFKDKL